MAAPVKTKVHVAKLKLFSKGVSKDSSCLFVSKNDYGVLFPGNEDLEGIICVYSHKQQVHVQHTKIIMVKVKSHAAPVQKGLTVWCNGQFIKTYNFKPDELMNVRPVFAYPLRKVVLGVPPEDQSFEYTCSNKFTTDFLLSVCQGKLLASKGQQLMLPRKCLSEESSDKKSGMNRNFVPLTVLECQPLSHGLITVNTEIVLTKLSEQKEETETMRNEDLSVPATISDFANCMTLNVELPDNGQFRLQCPQLTCKIISNSSQLITWDHCTEGDMGNLIGMSQETMMKIGLFHDSLTTICAVNMAQHYSSSDPARKKTKHERVVRIRMVECPLDCVVMLPSLWFNLTRSWKGQRNSGDGTVLIKKYELLEEESADSNQMKAFSQSPSWKSQVPYATAIHVCLVQCPRYSQTVSSTTILQKYFSVTRFVKKGDVIAIPSTSDPELEADSSDREEKFPVVFFKVSHIAPEVPANLSFLADVKHTDLFQENNVKSYVPKSMNYLNTAELPICGLTQHIQKLEEIIQPHIAKESKRNSGLIKEILTILLSGPSGCGKSLMCEELATRLNMHIVKINCYAISGDTSASTEARLKAILQGAEMYAPCFLLLENIQSLGKDRDGNAEDPRVSGAFHSLVKDILHKSDWPVIVIATTSNPKHISSDLHSGFLHQFDIKVPDEACRNQMIEQLLSDFPCSSDVSITYIAQRTAGFVLGDLIALRTQAKQIAFERVVKHCKTGKQPLSLEEEENIALCGTPLIHSDFQTALDKLQAAHSDAIGAPKIPDVKWDDVGGLADVKAEILDTIQLPLQHPELLAAGLRRSGVLLYGPPGTGKTLLAKAVATECSLNFLSVKGPELINMYVGQSEENVREVFSRARSASPCVIFFDELDSLAPNRGRTGDSGGVMDRVVSQLLAELDGLHKSCDVFVVGATNRPDLLDPALLRPGRFDKLLYLSVSEDNQSQLKILKALTRKFNLSDESVLEKIVEKCPMNLTGADFYALCSDAMLNAVKSRIDVLEKGGEMERDNLQVTEEDFLQALSSLVPSVSEGELKHYAQLQHTLGAQG